MSGDSFKLALLMAQHDPVLLTKLIAQHADKPRLVVRAFGTWCNDCREVPVPARRIMPLCRPCLQKMPSPIFTKGRIGNAFTNRKGSQDRLKGEI